MDCPSGWQMKSLQKLALINYGRSPAGILDDDGLYPVFGTAGAERLGNDYLYDGESIVLGRKGTIDRVHYASGKFWTIDTAYYTSNFKDVLPTWLFYFLQTVDLANLNEATGVPSILRDTLYKIQIPTPPVSEQAKIADILLTADRAIEQTEELIAKQQRIKTGLMQDLLTRGIDDHGDLRSEETHKFKDSPLGKIPAEWDVVQVGQAVESAVDGPFGSNLKTEHYVPEPGVRVIRLGNIGVGEFLDSDRAYISTERAKALARHSVDSGDLLIASLGDDKSPFGRACLYTDNELRAIVKADVFRLRCKGHMYIHPFAVHLFNFPRWRRGLTALAQGVTRDRVNLTNLMRLSLPKPSIDEQKVAGAMIEAAQLAIVEADRQLMKLRSLRGGLMQDLLTGSKRVTGLLGVEPKHEKLYATA